ncbi:MAG: family 20 glycosylhydrolase [Promethearchaeia archaeon]
MKYKLKALIIRHLRELKEFYVEKPNLIPRPKKLSLKKTKKQNAYILANNAELSFIRVSDKEILLNDLNSALAEFCNVQVEKSAPASADLEFFEGKDQWDILDINDPEAYNLEIQDNRICIYSIYEKGLFYGLQTLIQLVKNAFLTNPNLINQKKSQRDQLILPEIEIKDNPDLKVRGVADDISRGQIISVESAKRYIKILSHYKMNFYLVYIEDVFAHPKHPEIGKERGALTLKEIREIDAYAKERHVEFVPIFECLGHMDNILMHEKYRDLGEFPSAQCLDISNPDIFDFLEDYIGKLSDIFSTEYFHLGLDESFDLGKHRSKDFIEKHGEEKVLTEFYNELFNMAKKHGNRHIIMYDDIVRNNDEILENLEKDIILMYWNYAPQDSFPTVRDLIDAHHRVIVSPSMMNWERNFPDNKNASTNIINLTKEAYKNRNYGCMGVLTSTWGDQRYYSLRENEIFGGVLTADVSWNTPEFDYEEFKEKFALLFYGLTNTDAQKFNEMFSIISRSSEEIYRFVKIIPPFFYTYFFKHPFPEKEYTPTFSNYKELGTLAEEVLELYSELEPNVLFEKENFEYIQFGAELAKYLKEKIEISLKVSRFSEEPELIDRSTIEDEIERLEYIREKMRYLMVRYELLWTRSAKRPCLDANLELFEFLIDCYDKKIKQLKDKVYFKDPYLPSEWIWAKEKTCPPKPRYFKKRIQIESSIEKAVLQSICCNQGLIYVNGQLVGEVLSRYSLSILPILKRVKIFDITKHLKQGKNVIAVEAYNYEGYKPAINIYGQIKLKDGEMQEITSDDTWLSNREEEYQNTNWTFLDYDISEWDGVRTYGRPPNLNGDIYTPDLLNGEKSHTMDYFGIEGYAYNMSTTFTGKFTAKYIIRPLIHLVIKILKPFGK